MLFAFRFHRDKNSNIFQKSFETLLKEKHCKISIILNKTNVFSIKSFISYIFFLMITYIKKAIWMHFYICTQKTRVLFSPFYSLFYSLLQLSTSIGGQSQLDDFLYIKWIFFPTAFTKAFWKLSSS
jgi:hypothetical protein